MITKMNGVKGIHVLNNRFYLMDVLEKMFERYKENHPNIKEINVNEMLFSGLSPSGMAGGFDPPHGCSIQPSPSFSLRYF